MPLTDGKAVIPPDFFREHSSADILYRIGKNLPVRGSSIFHDLAERKANLEDTVWFPLKKWNRNRLSTKNRENGNKKLEARETEYVKGNS